MSKMQMGPQGPDGCKGPDGVPCSPEQEETIRRIIRASDNSEYVRKSIEYERKVRGY
jgi:hypothetical protein